LLYQFWVKDLGISVMVHLRTGILYHLYYMNRSLFFFALIPEARFSEKVRSLQEELKAKFALTYSMRIIPHITLQAPFECQEVNQSKLEECVDLISNRIKPLRLKSMNFGSFINSVVYINLEKNAELMELQEWLANTLESQSCLTSAQRNNDYVPHITLAHRDLDPTQFAEVWEYINQYPLNESFAVEKLVAFNHDGAKWVEYLSFPLDMEMVK